MGRLDYKRGRFGTDFETNEIHSGLRGWQAATIGDEVDWYVFQSALSGVNDIYDEGDGVGKVYDGPHKIPVLHATHLEGGQDPGTDGFYFNDDLHITASFDQLSRSGLRNMDQSHQSYLKDRIVYDGKVFAIQKIEVLGQIQQRDIIVGIDATQVKPDELVNDPQFAAWADVPAPKGWLQTDSVGLTDSAIPVKF